MPKPVDYSFMKTGYNNVVEAKPNEKIMEDLHVMWHYLFQTLLLMAQDMLNYPKGTVLQRRIFSMD